MLGLKYKDLFLKSQANNKILVERNQDLYKRDIEHQTTAMNEKKKLREEIAKLKIELEDTKKFLEMEKKCSYALRKERTALKKKISELKGVE